MIDEPKEIHIDDEKKEHSIEAVNKYNKITKIANITMIISILKLSIRALRMLADNLVSHDILPEIFQNPQNSHRVATVAVLTILTAILTKSYANDSINKIRDLFAQHGLVLDDEITDSKGRAK